MAENREQMTARLNELGKMWVPNPNGQEHLSSKARSIWMEIWELSFKLYSISGKNEQYADTLNDIITSDFIRNFDPAKGQLSSFLSSRLHLRTISKSNTILDRLTGYYDQAMHDSDDGSIDVFDYIAAHAIGGSGLLWDESSKVEFADTLMGVLSILSETIRMSSESGKGHSEVRLNYYLLFYSASLINMSRLGISLSGNPREESIMSVAKHRFFDFCFVDQKGRYLCFEDLTCNSLKNNSAVYAYAAKKGLDRYTLKTELANEPIMIPIPSNICIMFMYCEEGKSVTDSAFSQQKKHYAKTLRALLSQRQLI